MEQICRITSETFLPFPAVLTIFKFITALGTRKGEDASRARRAAPEVKVVVGGNGGGAEAGGDQPPERDVGDEYTEAGGVQPPPLIDADGSAGRKGIAPGHSSGGLYDANAPDAAGDASAAISDSADIAAVRTALAEASRADPDPDLPRIAEIGGTNGVGPGGDVADGGPLQACEPDLTPGGADKLLGAGDAGASTLPADGTGAGTEAEDAAQLPESCSATAGDAATGGGGKGTWVIEWLMPRLERSGRKATLGSLPGPDAPPSNGGPGSGSGGPEMTATEGEVWEVVKVGVNPSIKLIIE